MAKELAYIIKSEREDVPRILPDIIVFNDDIYEVLNDMGNSGCQKCDLREVCFSGQLRFSLCLTDSFLGSSLEGLEGSSYNGPLKLKK